MPQPRPPPIPPSEKWRRLRCATINLSRLLRLKQLERESKTAIHLYKRHKRHKLRRDIKKIKYALDNMRAQMWEQSSMLSEARSLLLDRAMPSQAEIEWNERIIPVLHAEPDEPDSKVYEAMCSGMNFAGIKWWFHPISLVWPSRIRAIEIIARNYHLERMSNFFHPLAGKADAANEVVGNVVEARVGLQGWGPFALAYRAQENGWGYKRYQVLKLR